MEQKRSLSLFYIEIVVFAISSIFILIFRNELITNIKYFVGAIMVFDGFHELAQEVLFYRKKFWAADKFALGLIDILFGVILISIPTLEYAVICAIWASWSIVKESYDIKETITEIKYIPAKIISAIESVVIIAFSVTLIMEPGENHAMVHLYLFIFEIIFSPVIVIIDEYAERYARKKALKNMSQDSNEQVEEANK